jgi:hypothetical protein
VEVVLASLLNAASYVLVAVLGLIGGRRLVGPNQDRLIDTLKNLVDAQQLKIETLESDAKIRDEKIASLDKQVIELKALTIFQAKEIERLTERLRT